MIQCGQTGGGTSGIGVCLYERELPAVKLEHRGNDWVLPRNWRPKAVGFCTTEAVSKTVDTPWLSVSPPSSDARPASAAQIRKFQSEAKRLGWDQDALIRKLRGRQPSELSSAEASRVIEDLLKADTHQHTAECTPPVAPSAKTSSRGEGVPGSHSWTADSEVVSADCRSTIIVVTGAWAGSCHKPLMVG